ncbi:HAMP domain-containing sensor histidine kinase [Ekhidna sp.]|uniref:sensor histidine kinase n=1 Tax=Ekhidna sp. TaxID=2608089 RepID=UPI00329746B3
MLFIVGRIEENEKEKNRVKLKEVNQLAVFEFSESLNVFLAYMSGIRSYLKSADDFPSQQELFDFAQYHLRDLDSRDSLVISYLNKNHRFIYSFDRNRIDPSDLVSLSVRDLRDELEIERLDELMKDEEFHLFPPINLVEGWVGLPLNFSVIRDNEAIGYIAAILRSESLIESIYKQDISNEFIFSFQVGDEIYFDREMVHDSTKVYHPRVDSSFVKNYATNESDFLYSDIELYGLPFKIGTAYKKNATYATNLDLLTYGWFIMLFLFGLNAFYRINKYRKLNTSLDMTLQSLNYQHSLLNKKNKELEESNNTKDKIFSIIGHDLKAPLSSIQSIIELMQNQTLSKADSKKMMLSLEPVVVNASGLLERLLKWSMINTNKLEVKPEVVKLKELNEEIIKLLQVSANQKNISIISNIDATISVYADYNMISFIIRNIVSNALKFSKEGSEIQISSEVVESEKVVVSIKDQGVGMSQNQLDQLFQIGNRKIKIGTMGEKGSGLGLVMVQEFASQNSININVESQVGQGTIFNLSIPSC